MPVKKETAWISEDRSGLENNQWLNSMMSNINPGSEIHLRPGTYPMEGLWTISKPCKVFGHGATLTWPNDISNDKGINIVSSGIQISGLTLDGPQHVTGNYTQQGVYAHGSDSSDYLSGIKLVGMEITGFGGYGVEFDFVENFEITGCHIHKVWYACIGVLSGRFGSIHHNIIEDINSDAPNEYGIYLSRTKHDELSVYPRSHNISVDHNIIKNIVHWEGLDTHGGENITFDGNIITGCMIGINVGPSGNSVNNPVFAPLDCHVTNNIIKSQSANGDKSYGITFVGAHLAQYGSGSIISNTVEGYGDESNNISGALCIQNTKGLVISSNRFTEPSPYAIHMYIYNIASTITANQITDAWSNTGVGVGILCNNDGGGFNSGVISGNSFLKDSKVASSVMVESVRVETSPNIDIIIGENYEEI